MWIDGSHRCGIQFGRFQFDEIIVAIVHWLIIVHGRDNWFLRFDFSLWLAANQEVGRYRCRFVRLHVNFAFLFAFECFVACVAFVQNRFNCGHRDQRWWLDLLNDCRDGGADDDGGCGSSGGGGGDVGGGDEGRYDRLSDRVGCFMILQLRFGGKVQSAVRAFEWI